MPQTIRQALFSKLENSPKLAELRTDFKALAGVPLHLVSPSIEASSVKILCSNGAICPRVHAASRGRAHCQKFSEDLLAESEAETPSCKECDAGLTGFCASLRIRDVTIGHLLAGGYRLGEFDAARRNRARHLLGRLGVSTEGSILDDEAHDTTVISQATQSALQRWLQLAAEALMRSLELREDDRERPLPTYITKICSVIQKNYRNPPTLGEAAQICGLSEGYFCRAFHEFTGLRFIEYIHAVRVEHACQLLQNERVSITDTAYESGFQSLSQFNRVFRKLRGSSPRQWRQEQRLLASH